LQEEINSKSKQIERYEKRIIAVEIENTVIYLFNLNTEKN
jgi:hypothetical protein